MIKRIFLIAFGCFICGVLKAQHQQIFDEYRMEAGKLRIEMVEILREKARVDAFLQELTLDEATFVEMRFEKGYGFDYIAMKMHLSRATVFRIQDRVLEKMGLWRKNEML